jgi:hypothetical protein
MFALRKRRLLPTVAVEMFESGWGVGLRPVVRMAGPLPARYLMKRHKLINNRN